MAFSHPVGGQGGIRVPDPAISGGLRYVVCQSLRRQAIMDKFDTSSPRRAQVDAKAVRRQVRSILHSLDRMRSSEAYWQGGAVANEVRQLLEQGWTLIQGDDGRNALALLEAITEAYVADWTNLDDSDGEASGFFQDLVPICTQALLSVDPSSRERKVSASKLETWHQAT